MRNLMTFFGLFAVVLSGSNALAINKSGNAPTVVCMATNYKNENEIVSSSFKKFDLALPSETRLFAENLIMETEEYKYVVGGSVNSEEEIWLGIEKKGDRSARSFSRGRGWVAITIGLGQNSFHKIDCGEVSVMKEHYLENVCNADGSTKPGFEANTTCPKLKELLQF